MSESTREPIEECDGVEEETSGPRVGVYVDLEGASVVLQHHLNESAKSITPIDRGFNNRSYIVTSQSNHKYILRLGGRYWTRKKTEREVATLMFLKRCRPNIPLPNVIGFCADREKSGINAEYILMEKLEGLPLDEIYGSLKEKELGEVLEQVADIFQQIHSVKFDKIGSLECALIAADADSSGFCVNLDAIKVDDFSVGGVFELGCGPFLIYLDFFIASVEVEIVQLRKCEFLRQNLDLIPRIEQFLSALKSSSLPLPVAVYKDVPIVLVHGDFEPRNMLIKDGKITGMLDWEFSGAFPVDADFFDGFEGFGNRTNQDDVFDEEGNLRRRIKNYNFNWNGLMEDMLRKKNVLTGSEIDGHFERAELHYFKGSICPWWMREVVPVVGEELEEWEKERDISRKVMEAVLSKYGF